MAKATKPADAFMAEGGRRMVSGRAPLNRFIPCPDNPRTHPPEEIAFLAYLLTRYGADQPIVVDEKWIILKGHGRREGALMAKLPDFPYVQRFGLSEAEKIAMRIEDNQSALLAGWNIPIVTGQVSQLKMLGYDINKLGFGQSELVQFTTTPGPDGGAPATGMGSLAERFGVVPFSVLNAREGWWQDRKRAWLALGIQSELGRGENLIERSPQELFCHATGMQYGKARKIVTDAMERDGDKFDLNALINQHNGHRRKKPNVVPGGGNRMPLDRAKKGADFSRSGAVVAPGGGMVDKLRRERGYTP